MHGLAACEEVSDIKQATSALHKAKAPGGKLSGALCFARSNNRSRKHCETWNELASPGQFDGQGDYHSPKPFVRKAFKKYLECDIFAHGFARARCGDCGHDYFVAFSCKGRGVFWPSICTLLSGALLRDPQAAIGLKRSKKWAGVRISTP